MCGKFTRALLAHQIFNYKFSKPQLATKMNSARSYEDKGGAKSKYAKIEKSCSLKSCDHSLESTFVLRIFKILSVDGRASASKVEKKDKKVEIFQYFGDFFKS
jgi:hypothetical protein